MIIRTYKSSDYEAAIRLWWDSWHSSSGYPHPKAITHWKQRWHELEQTHDIVIVEEQGQLVAFAALDTRNCVLSQIFVSPGQKRRGIGRRLIRWVESKCSGGFSLKTATTNTESRAFYKKLGLLEVGRSINDFNGREEVEYARIFSDEDSVNSTQLPAQKPSLVTHSASY